MMSFHVFPPHGEVACIQIYTASSFQVHGLCVRAAVKWRHGNLWSQYDLYVVEQHGVLCEVTWCRFVALFEQNWIFKDVSALSLSYWESVVTATNILQ